MDQPLPAGKFPGDLLESFLSALHVEDPSLLIGPRVGEDIAAVDVAEDDTLILTSDPITFVSDALGRYPVVINANDIATSGATPRWFLVTLLAPPGTTPRRVLGILSELAKTCRKQGISLCGGHTEITEAVTRPVVTGMMAGTVERARLLDKRDMKPGDVVLLTKAVAVEGTAIIAHEFEGRLLALGFSKEEISTCKGFIHQLSVLREAGMAGNHEGVRAMHDVTEGGLATALEELSVSGGHRIRADLERIPVFHETASICKTLNLNPMGLIGSGSLLICCRKDTSDSLLEKLKAAGIQATRIAEVLKPGRGVAAFDNAAPAPWPHFDVDEITRLY
jgi:hydrogenase expression/formation protein HypE